MILPKLCFLSLLAFLGFSLCDRPSVASFVGRLSINGLLANDGPNSTSSFGPAPDKTHPNWTSSMHNSDTTLSKRAGEPNPRNHYGPVLAGENCVLCPAQKLLELDPVKLLRRLKSRLMKTYMRGSPGDLLNRCVFYTRAELRPSALSRAATDWACLYDKYSIWHLWPNKRMQRQNPDINDFYGIYEPGNWLYGISELPKPLLGPGPPTIYFQEMSEAMAESCSGEVVIVTEEPERMKELYTTRAGGNTDFQNIWGDRERPALVTLFNNGIAGPFYVVDVRKFYQVGDPYTVYDFDIIRGVITGVSNRVFVPGQNIKARGDMLTNETETQDLQKRGSCTLDNAVDSELQSASQYIDYFAGFYVQDYP